jgi:pSer/pThr/pTyr-binding forkhead associated (FHA) protein
LIIEDGEENTMLLRYINSEGKQVETELGPKSLLIGRSANANIPLADEKASRLHCEIRLWDGEYVAKDLKSRNGTFINEKRIEIATLHFGDALRVGNTVFQVEKKSLKGAKTILREVSQEMDGGKGYRTILREIVSTTGTGRSKPTK